MSTLEQALTERVKELSKQLGRKPRLLFSEGTDSRVAEAATRAKSLGIEAQTLLEGNVLQQAAKMLADGQVDAVVSGAVNTTADVLRAGLKNLERLAGVKTISSSFHLELRDGKRITYGDCGVVPYPNGQQLADIAIASAATHQKLTGETPQVALLSFSTLGSAKHEKIDLVREALALIRQQNPQLLVDGELQFDAAFVPAVAARKAPQSPVAGKANVFIFPNLDAGNIAYKITERIGGALAVGPILQGFSKPWMDLSRGCSATDVLMAGLVGLVLSR